MSNLRRWRLLSSLILLFALLGGCSRDPNVRKQKYFESGTRYFQEEKYREAAIQYLNAIQVDPGYVEAHYQLAQCYLKLEVWSGAYQELLRTVDLQPDNLKARVSLGNLLLAAHDFQKAEDQAELILKKDSNNVEGHILLANAYAGQEKNLEISLQEMQLAIQLDPGRPESYLNLAYIQWNAGQSAAAEQSFKKAVQLGHESVPTLLALGSFYQQLRRWEGAEQQFRRALELEPKNVQPYTALGRLYLAQGRTAQAEQIVTQGKQTISDKSEGYRMRGDFYFNVGQFDKALAEYASLYKEHPKDLRVKKNYIQLLILRGKLDEAAKLNDAILKESPADVDSAAYRGQILARQGRPNDAIPFFEKALKAEPDNALTHYYLGLAFQQVGNLARAEGEWREAVRLRPSLTDAQQALVGIAMRKGDYDLLSQSAAELIKANSASPVGYVLRARARIARGDQARAEADLKQAIQVAPQDASGYQVMGGLRSFQKRFAEAEKLFNQALDRDPNSVEAMQGLVGSYFQQKQPARALARLQEQISRAPNNSAFYFLSGALLFNAKEPEKAETALQKAVELDKNNMSALILLGQVQAARGSMDKAITGYQQAIQQNPLDIRLYVLLGVLEEGRGNWQKAQELYQKALQVEPGYPLAAMKLASLLLEHGGNVDVALSLAQVARQRLADSPDAAGTLGWAYYHKNVYRLAIDLLEEAVKSVPADPAFHYHLGLAYQKANDPVRAKQHLERALAINPNGPLAGEIRKALSELSGD